MRDPSSLGEYGGIFAGATAILALLGAAVKWIAGWRERQATSRAGKLEAWHKELERREAKLDQQQQTYQARIEQRLAALESENNALRLAFELVAGPLRAVDPTNQALAKAEQLLTAAFPLVPTTPHDMRAQLGAIERG
jgi:hypothetical protein